FLSAEEIWCEGCSEPESGSDLASLKTKAVKSNGGWKITGQKVWTTYAHEAKWCMLVARSDPDAPKHKGLTYFLMDMEQDGVQVRPLRQITGESEFNEIFMEEAYIPDENVVGQPGEGWNVAITTLMNERAGIAFGSAVGVKIALGELMELVRERGLDDDPVIRQRVAQLYIESETLRLNAYRGLTGTMKRGYPGPEGSLPKWQWSDINQPLTELVIVMEELGCALAPAPFFSNAAAGLAILHGGSDEQKQRWLSGIASGEQRGTVGVVANGEAPLVPDADSTSVIVLIDGDTATL